jgi:hypothetical protein
MKHILIALSFVSFTVEAATYYVATNGSNANPGTEASPWRNVWYAATHVSAGDTVQIGPGEFNESVTNTVSGTAGNPIIFKGTRDGTNYLTKIDRSVSITGWSAAPEIGDGVWKKTGLPFETKEMTIGGKRIAYVRSLGTVQLSWTFDPPMTTGAEILASPTNTIVKLGYTQTPQDYWTGIKALWAASGNTTYLRLWDKSNPDSLDVRIAPNRDNLFITYWTYEGANVLMSGVSYITWQDLEVRGAFCGFYIKSGAHDINIISNKLANGNFRINAYNGVYNLLVQGNDMSADYYGWTNAYGAWSGDLTIERNRIGELLYEHSKYPMGDASQSCYDFYAYMCGTNLQFIGNYSHHSLGDALCLTSYGSRTIGSVIASNTFVAHPSAAIIICPWVTETKMYDNVIKDCNAAYRVASMNNSDDTNRVMYFYRNRVYLPYKAGDFFYGHMYGSAPTYWPSLYFYHNSLSGGRSALAASADFANFGGFKNCRFINNLFSHASYFFFWVPNWNTGSTYCDTFDYNIVADMYTPDTIAWWDAHNIKQSSAEWSHSEDMTFALLDGSAAINAGEDLPTDYPALPQDATTKVGSAWDIGWNEYNPVDDPVLSVTPLSHDYGELVVGTTADYTFGVTNMGTGTLTGLASTTAPFSVMAGGSYSLGAGQGQFVIVRYAPGGPGSSMQYLSLTGGNGANVLLSGQATNPPPIHFIGRLRSGLLRSR